MKRYRFNKPLVLSEEAPANLLPVLWVTVNNSHRVNAIKELVNGLWVNATDINSMEFDEVTLGAAGQVMSYPEYWDLLFSKLNKWSNPINVKDVALEFTLYGNLTSYKVLDWYELELVCSGYTLVRENRSKNPNNWSPWTVMPSASYHISFKLSTQTIISVVPVFDDATYPGQYPVNFGLLVGTKSIEYYGTMEVIKGLDGRIIQWCYINTDSAVYILTRYFSNNTWSDFTVTNSVRETAQIPTVADYIISSDYSQTNSRNVILGLSPWSTLTSEVDWTNGVCILYMNIINSQGTLITRMTRNMNFRYSLPWSTWAPYTS